MFLSFLEKDEEDLPNVIALGVFSGSAQLH